MGIQACAQAAGELQRLDEGWHMERGRFSTAASAVDLKASNVGKMKIRLAMSRLRAASATSVSKSLDYSTSGQVQVSVSTIA